MKTLLSPDLSPTACLEVDSPSARELSWLPYAVRFKLDASGLRMSLRDWQGLPLAQRMALLRAPLVEGAGGFEPLALAIGASKGTPRMAPAEVAFDASELRALRIHDVEAWSASATAFARYVLRKIATKKHVHEAT